MADWCVVKTNRRHFATKGRLHCHPHFVSELDKAPSKIQFLFRDVYSRSLTRLPREIPKLRFREAGTESGESRGDLYTVPVIFFPLKGITD